MNRIDELVENNSLFKEIFENEFIFINNKKLKNWKLMKEKIEKKINMMFNEG